MTVKRVYGVVLLGLILALPCIYPEAVRANEVVDHALFGELLKKHLHEDLLDYRGVQQDEALLDRYLEVLKKVDTSSLDRNERFAFFINAYNAWTIKLILTEYPDLKSIKDLGSIFRGPWKQKIARIDGELVTLDHIEHDILRPQFKDPRVHFAVNCASKGCPSLRFEPYTGKALDAQLDEQTRATFNDPGKTVFKENVLYVNKVFDWFGEDFKEGALPFVKAYAENGLKARLESAEGDVKIKYLDWDWDLNDWNRR